MSTALPMFNFTRLTNLRYNFSKNYYTKDGAMQIREATENSIGTYIPAKTLELKHIIKLIRKFDAAIAEIKNFNKSYLPDKILAFSGLRQQNITIRPQ